MKYVVFEDERGYRHQLTVETDSDLGGVSLSYEDGGELVILWLDDENARDLAGAITTILEEDQK